MTKVCTKCGVEKALEMYSKEKSKGENKLRSECKECQRKYNAEYRLINSERLKVFYKEKFQKSKGKPDYREKATKRVKLWRDTNPEKAKAAYMRFYNSNKYKVNSKRNQKRRNDQHNLEDWYLIMLIRRHSKFMLTVDDIEQSLIDLKKQSLQLSRELKKINNDKD